MAERYSIPYLLLEHDFSPNILHQSDILILYGHVGIPSELSHLPTFSLYDSSWLSKPQVPERLPYLNPTTQDWASKFLTSDKSFFISEDLFGIVFWGLSFQSEYGQYLFGTNYIKEAQPFQQEPFVDNLIEKFYQALRLNGVDIPQPKTSTKPIATIDVDNAYAIQHKPLHKALLGGLKQGTSEGIQQLPYRWQVWKGYKEDPYYTLLKAHFPLGTKLFLLAADQARDERDTNLPINSTAMKRYLTLHKERFKIGLHPSFAAGDKQDLSAHEKQNLEKALKQEIKSSRQHYLRLRIPQTYFLLSSLGIQEDYSCGFPNSTGFRAGTVRCFRFFDLEMRAASQLLVTPFIWMDSTFNYHRKLTPSQAAEEIVRIHEGLTHLGLDYHVILHNETLGHWGAWHGWKELIKQLEKLLGYKLS